MESPFAQPAPPGVPYAGAVWHAGLASLETKSPFLRPFQLSGERQPSALAPETFDEEIADQQEEYQTGPETAAADGFVADADGKAYFTTFPQLGDLTIPERAQLRKGDAVASPFALAAPGGVPPLERERVGYGDERWPVDDTWAVPHRWVCSLDIVYAGDPDVRRGSGVLVGPRQVLTAAHNVYRGADGKAPESVHVIPAREGRTEPIGRFKAVAYSVPGAYLADRVVGNTTIRGPHPNARFDFALVTLERDVADGVLDKARDPRPFGHWGHRQQGQLTHLRGLDGTFLHGKPVVVAGYPGDRCGRAVLDQRAGCDGRDLATVQFRGTGMVRVTAPQPGMLLHTADTHEGQSGSPVWMRFNDGSRYLVGIHVGAGPKDPKSGLYPHNLAVQMSPEVVSLVRSWMPGVHSL